MGNVISLLLTAWKSLLVHKLRSFLSILGVVCGVMAVMAMIATGEGAKREILSKIEDMGLKNIYIKRLLLSVDQQREAQERKSYGVTLEDMKRLRDLGGDIVRVAALRELNAAPVGARQAVIPRVIRCTADISDILSLTVISGRFITTDDCRQNSLVCVLGASLAKNMGGEARVGNFIRLQDTLFKIIGILAEGAVPGQKKGKEAKGNFNTALLIPLVYGEWQESPAESVTEIVAEVDKKEHVEAVASMIDRRLQVAHNAVRDYQLVIPLQLLTQSLQTRRIFDLVLAVTGGLSLFIGGIGIMNIMLAAVSERRREIGIRRAVGATKRDIIFQFLTESVLLTSVGGTLGVLAGCISIHWIETFTGWPVKLTFSSLSLPFILSVATGIFAGSYPAVQAAGLDPMQALRAV